MNLVAHIASTQPFNQNIPTRWVGYRFCTRRDGVRSMALRILICAILLSGCTNIGTVSRKARQEATESTACQFVFTSLRQLSDGGTQHTIRDTITCSELFGGLGSAQFSSPYKDPNNILIACGSLDAVSIDFFRLADSNQTSNDRYIGTLVVKNCGGNGECKVPVKMIFDRFGEQPLFFEIHKKDTVIGPCVLIRGLNY